MSTSAYPITQSTCVRRATHQKKGRTIWLSPQSAALRHLHYGRIILDAGDAPVQFANGNQETGLISLRGKAEVSVGEARFTMVPYDAIYIPRDSQILVKAAAEGCDLAEVAAPVNGNYPLQFVPYEDIKKDSTLHFHAGGRSAERDLNILLGKNVKAGRICAGVTFSEPGNWTSWPPHEHTDMLEEAYLYINMPAPSWGVQFVYNDPANPELMVVVREGDCVVMPGGYHPNVSAPGGSIGFLWMMAAHREVEDRQFGVVNVQPEYAAGGSGLEASRK
jgi:5-deoxy-glucuronate isomerase